MKNSKIQSKEDGLTLIEVLIGLIVIGLLTVAFLQFFAIDQERKRMELQEYKFFTIADGFLEYLSHNGHYPCPAQKGLSVTDPNFGVATDCTEEGDVAIDDLGEALSEGYNVTSRSGGTERIRIGTIPYKEIGIGPEDVIDVYGNQITYAVLETLATSRNDYEVFTVALDSPDPVVVATANNSMIDVQGAVCARIPDVADSDGDGDVTELVDDRDFDTRICRNWNDVPEFSEFTFFSHGENGAGTYNSAGVLIPNACNTAIGSESENCDNDSTFSTETFLAHSPTTSGDFDDQLTNSLISWTYIWDNPPTDEKNIFNRARGNMAVGLDANNPAEEKMQIAGNLRAEAQLIGGGVFDENGGGKVQTVNVCDKDGDISPDNDPGDANCFDPAVIGGDLANTDRLHCPDSGHMVAGIVDGKAVCRSILLDTTASCPNLQYVVGFSVDPNTGTLSLNCRSAF